MFLNVLKEKEIKSARLEAVLSCCFFMHNNYDDKNNSKNIVAKLNSSFHTVPVLYWSIWSFLCICLLWLLHKKFRENRGIFHCVSDYICLICLLDQESRSSMQYSFVSFIIIPLTKRQASMLPDGVRVFHGAYRAPEILVF